MAWAPSGAAQARGDPGEESTPLMPLVTALRRIPMLADRSGRELVVRMVGEALREHLPVEDHKYPVGHLFSIAEVCCRRPERLSALVRVLEMLEQDSRPMVALRDLVRDMTTLALWSDEARGEVLALLSGVVVPDIEGVYLAVAGPSAPPLRGSTTYQEVFRTLETLNARPDGVPRSLLFVEHIAARVRTELAVRLHHWVDRQAAALDLAAEVASARWEVREGRVAAPARPSDAYVVFQLCREGLRGDVHRLSQWHQLDLSTGWHPVRGADFTGDLEAVKHRVAEAVEGLEADWAGFAPRVHVEFVLAAELINLDVDQWPWETDAPLPEPLGCRYPVAVRSLERMAARKYHRSWHQRWELLRSQLDRTGAIHEDATCWGGDGSARAVRELMSKLQRDAAAVSLVLSSPPHPESRGRDEIAVGLRAGIPVVIWDRAGSDDGFVARARRLLHEDNPRDLLERVRLARSDVFEAGGDGGLTVLWDDPSRVVLPVHPTAPEGV
ncbi:VMAP-C domain-containing protein [Saccharothrix syringae]|uniref:Uncharacterized protein n=1 Tax=Saccharothrix syringae TaxID=103733 RepID=A0A5Q0H808_SACSY|nr:hypothetical protein [Saccharothrix syringae]QFZ21970.1 hypothetical protein EKG83_35240 [Saccharothrix syringae]